MHKEDTPAEVAIENWKYNKLKYGIFLFTLDGKFIKREEAPSQTFWLLSPWAASRQKEAQGNFPFTNPKSMVLTGKLYHPVSKENF